MEDFISGLAFCAGDALDGRYHELLEVGVEVGEVVFAGDVFGDVAEVDRVVLGVVFEGGDFDDLLAGEKEEGVEVHAGAVAIQQVVVGFG